jgi:hypothetical protein
MTQSQRIVANVPAERQRGGIRWLVIEADCGGWFLFLHDEWPGPCKWDHFLASREDALAVAESEYGVGADNWRDVDDESAAVGSRPIGRSNSAGLQVRPRHTQLRQRLTSSGTFDALCSSDGGCE